MTAMKPQPMQNYLKQRHLLFGSREFIIKGTESLLIREKSLFRHHETVLPLHTLQANPTYSSSFAMKWLLISLFMATLTGLVSYTAHHFALPALYLFAAVLGGTTIVMLYRFFLYTTKLTIFRHAVSNENYLYLWQNRPNKRHFETFIRELSQLIREHNRPAKSP